MKAAVYKRYGQPGVLQINEVDKPTPKSNEILLRVKATAVNSGDVRLRKADPFAVRFFFGLIKPKTHILGSVYSGEVEGIGTDVRNVQIGDALFGHTDMKFGAYAEYIILPAAGSFAIKPAMISHEEAAAIPFGAVTARHFLRKANIQPGQKLLVVGASGAVGTAAIQLAKTLGAHVTSVCSAANVDLVKSLGADKVIDYTTEDFTKNGETYDLIFDTVNSIDIARSARSLSRNGVMILSAAEMPEMLQGLWISMTGKHQVITGVTKHSAEDIQFLKELIEAGKFKPVIDTTYTVEQIAAAHAYVEKGHKKGNVVITIKN